MTVSIPGTDGRRRSRSRRGALLLEVLIALTIAVAALGLLSAQLVNGLLMTQYAHEQTRVNELADRLLSLMELDLETQARILADEVSEGDFGDAYPGFHWRVQVERADRDVPGLMRVVLEVLRQEDASKPKEIRGATVLRTMALLKADPARIDLAEHFGFSEDMLTQLSETVPIPGFDPNNLDIQALVAMEPAQLLAMLPALMPILQGMLGMQGMPGDPSSMTPEQLQQFILEQLAQGGGVPGMGPPGGPAGFPPGSIDPNTLADRIRGEVMARGGPGQRSPGAPFNEPTSDRAPGAGPGGPEAQALADMIRQRAIEAGATPGAAPGAGRGGRRGMPGRGMPGGGMQGGAPPGGMDGAPGGMDSGALEAMIWQRVLEAQGGGGPPAGRPGRGAAGRPGMGGGRPGMGGGPGAIGPGAAAGAPQPGGQQPATIEDLMRMRDQYRSGQGGRRR